MVCTFSLLHSSNHVICQISILELLVRRKLCYFCWYLNGVYSQELENLVLPISLIPSIIDMKIEGANHAQQIFFANPSIHWNFPPFVFTHSSNHLFLYFITYWSRYWFDGRLRIQRILWSEIYSFKKYLPENIS